MGRGLEKGAASLLLPSVDGERVAAPAARPYTPAELRGALVPESDPERLGVEDGHHERALPRRNPFMRPERRKLESVQQVGHRLPLDDVPGSRTLPELMRP